MAKGMGLTERVVDRFLRRFVFVRYQAGDVVTVEALKRLATVEEVDKGSWPARYRVRHESGQREWLMETALQRSPVYPGIP